MKYTNYTLLMKPNGKFPLKLKHFKNIKNDEDVITKAHAYAKEHDATIYRLIKTITEDIHLITEKSDK